MRDASQILPLDGCANLTWQLTGDFVHLSKTKINVPGKYVYKVASSLEPACVTRSARKAAFFSVVDEFPVEKFAFDSRRINQENERNPRTNLQYWHRSQQFIDKEAQMRLEAFGRLLSPLQKIRKKFGSQPEYFQSFARGLYDSISRIVRIQESDVDMFRPQLDYLEQLLFARYRISTEDLVKLSEAELGDRILAKDEDLLKRGSFLQLTKDLDVAPPEENKPIIKNDDVGGVTQESLVNAIFGNNDIRRDGDGTVERTITITIRDAVIE
jgi:hypothetical protein